MPFPRRCRHVIWEVIAVFFSLHLRSISCLSSEIKSMQVVKSSKLTSPLKTRVSVPLANVRPKAESSSEQFWSLWNDKRSIVSLIRDGNGSNKESDVPYCIVSDEFEVEGGFRFQVLLYPRGVTSSTDQPLRGTPASAYLSFLPSKYGEEVDVCWKLRLVDGETEEALPIATSGGLPRSKDTWSAAMTFCTPNEAVDSVGRACDWGCSAWNSRQIYACLSNLRAEVDISVFNSRQGESSFFTWPPKGGLGAAQKAAATVSGENRSFRAGEIIVAVPKDVQQKEKLQKLGVFPGNDYRVMTIMGKDGNELFSTESLPEELRQSAKLALRPVGWKLQQQMWETRGFPETDWPVEVTADNISSVALSRFNAGASVPRFVTFFAQDFKSVILALTLALAPIPLALVGRELFSFYAIPSASMEPTLLKGDVLLVEKLPGVFSRTRRGDIVLFRPPSALTDIIRGSGGELSKDQLFVKRLVGLPGDERIAMQEDTQEVTINNIPVVGPHRSLCDDEPLRLIDRLLENGKGKDIEALSVEDTYVLGDCKAVSVDSRVFGKLPKKNIVGRPVARIWPLDRLKLGSP